MFVKDLESLNHFLFGRRDIFDIVLNFNRILLHGLNSTPFHMVFYIPIIEVNHEGVIIVLIGNYPRVVMAAILPIDENSIACLEGGCGGTDGARC